MINGLDRILLVCLLACASSWTTFAATLTAQSPAQAHVQAKINEAVDGDTVLVPAGTATWTSRIDFGSKGISVIGAGATNGTTINNSAGTLVLIANTGSKNVRLSGFNFVNSDNQINIIRVMGPVLKLRVDYNRSNKGDNFLGANMNDGRGNGPVYGVVDHNTFVNMKRPDFAHDVRVGDVEWGQQAWAEWNLTKGAAWVGSGNNLFWEDNDFVWNSSNTDMLAQGGLYGQYGAKRVHRFNTYRGMQPFVDAHGDSPSLGTILYEMYNNTFIEGSAAGFQGLLAWQRGGSWIVMSNNFVCSILPYRISIYWTTDVNVPTNTFIFKNLRNGSLPASQHSSIMLVQDSGQTPAGWSAARVKENQNYWFQLPNATNGKPAGVWNGYTPYTYPHPLVSGSSPSPQPPFTPSNVTPANGATGASLLPVLTGSNYSDPAGSPQNAAQFQVYNAAGSAVVWDSGVLGAVKTTTVGTSLANSTLYQWRVRYRNADGIWSSYSSFTTFRTLDPTPVAPNTPVNATPAAGATGISLNPILSAPYVDPLAAGQSTSQWIVTDSTGAVTIYDSTSSAGAVTSHQVPGSLLSYSTQYKWKVRYANVNGLYSSYSTPTSFTTADPPPTPPIVLTNAIIEIRGTMTIRNWNAR